MINDLERIEKSGRNSIKALRSILTALEITNTLREKESGINPLIGQYVVIKTIEPKRHDNYIPINLRVTKLTTAVLRSTMEELRRLDPSPDMALNVNVSENEGRPLITISLINENSGRT